VEQVAQASGWAAALEASGLGVAMSDSLYAYPVVNVLHLLGLTLLVGPILLLDLRLLGFGRRHVAADAASRLLTPFTVAGALIAVTTGPLLFVADAKALSGNALLGAKLALLAVAVLNAWLFRLWWRRLLPDWDLFAPRLARLQSAASIALWFAVAGLGRLIAYL
jgi:hypothetical protein